MPNTWHRQTAHIRLLLEKQSNQGLSCPLLCIEFLVSSSDSRHFFLEKKEKEALEIETLEQ